MKSDSYRSDIQVLRGFAVFLVFLNHFIPLSFKNSFVGVDIFFVISGYVVASSSFTRLTAGTFTFISFIKRRFLRIYPSLLFVVTISLFLYSLLTFTSGTAARAALASYFSFSNIYFFLTSSDYYASTSVLQPFLHTWSLGVEFQFYILFPFVFPFIIRRRFRFHFIVVLLLLSFSLLLGLYDFNAFFYLPFARIWQFYLGIFAFKLSTLGFCFSRFNFKPFIFTSLLVFSSLPAHFPFIGPILASFLTFIFLVTNSQFPSLCPLLSVLIPFFSVVGKFSYSLYLWHWPLISIASVAFGTSTFSLLLAFCLTLIFSLLSFVLLESNSSLLNKSIRPSAIFRLIFIWVLSSPFLSVFSALFLKSKLIPQHIINQYDGTYPGYSDFLDCSDVEILSLPPGCIFNSDNISSPRSIFVLGDSHSTHLGPAFLLHSLSTNDKIFMSGQSGIPFPPLLVSRSTSRPRDSEVSLYRKQKSNLSFLSKNLSSGDLVVISNFTQRYFGIRTPLNVTLNFITFDPISGTALDSTSSYSYWIQSLEKFISDSSSLGASIIYILPTLELNNSYTLPQQCYSYFPAVQSLKSGCSYSVRLFKKSYSHVVDDLLSLNAKYSNFFIYDPIDYLCTDTCSILDTRTNKLFLYDLDHLSLYGSKFLHPSLSRFIQGI